MNISITLLFSLIIRPQSWFLNRGAVFRWVLGMNILFISQKIDDIVFRANITDIAVFVEGETIVPFLFRLLFVSSIKSDNKWSHTTHLKLKKVRFVD